MSVRDELFTLYERDGFLSPTQVLEAASAPDHPLHTQFTWDDTEAARRYRLNQARGLIMRCKVTVDINPEDTRRVRAFVSVPVNDDRREYVSLEDAMSDERRDLVLQQAMRDVASLRRKYRHLCDIDGVFRQVIDGEGGEQVA